MLRSQWADRLVPVRVQRVPRDERTGNRNPQEVRLVRSDSRNPIQHSGVVLQTVQQLGMHFGRKKCGGWRLALRCHQSRRNILHNNNNYHLFDLKCMYSTRIAGQCFNYSHNWESEIFYNNKFYNAYFTNIFHMNTIIIRGL